MAILSWESNKVMAFVIFPQNLRIHTLFILSCQLLSISINALKFSATLRGSLSPNGFHRTLQYDGNVTLNLGEKISIESCQLVLQQNIPSDLYIDLDEVKNKEKFNGPKVITKAPFNTEQPSFESKSQSVFIYPSHLKIDRNFIAYSLRISIHARYQFSTENGSNVIVKLSPPNLYLSCGNKLENDVETIKAPCSASWKSKCNWIQVKNISQQSNGFVFEVPTGDKSKTFPVTVITLSTAIISSLAIICKTMEV